MKEKKRIDAASDEPVFRQEIAEAAKDLGFAVPPDGEAMETGRISVASVTKRSPDGKFVVRKERKGRKGKTVTLVRTSGLSEAAIDDLARELRRSLGCGSSVEDDVIVAQGDMVTRCAEFLQKKGFRFVISGG